MKLFSKAQEGNINKFEFIKSPTNIIFSSVIMVLIIALVCSMVVIERKNNAIKDIKSEMSDNQSKIDDADSRIKDFEAQLAEKDKENSDCQSQLEAAQNEKTQLEEENSKLKKEIENLSAEKANRNATPAGGGTLNAPAPDGNKVCYLTFDDGPSENTLKILEILDRYNIKATFFVINSPNIAYVKNIYEAGHTVGLHSASHDYSKIYTGVDAYFDDLNTISNIVESIIGVKPTVIRFPGGSSNKVSRDYCPGLMTQLVTLAPERGYQYFDWNVASGDANSVTPSYTYIRNNVLSSAKTKNTACVLMHDAKIKTTTVQALPEIIEGLIKMGYTFDSIKPDTFGYHHRNLNN